MRTQRRRTRAPHHALLALIIGPTERQELSKNATLSQLSIAGLLARGDYVVPIPGSRNPERVAQNVAAAAIQLKSADLARIDAIAPNGGITNNS